MRLLRAIALYNRLHFPQLRRDRYMTLLTVIAATVIFQRRSNAKGVQAFSPGLSRSDYPG